MVRRYTWMLCATMLCLLWLSSLTNTSTAATPVATPALTLLQDDDAEGGDADEASPDDSGEEEAEAKEEKKAAFKPAAGSLSYLKIGLIVLFFLPWVRYVDSINRDTMEFGNKLKLEPEIWNPILVGSFLVGLLAVLFVPIFWAGFPFCLLYTSPSPRDRTRSRMPSSA